MADEHPDSFTELIARFERDGDVALEHAPDGDLQRVWEPSRDGVALARAASCVGEPVTLVAMACACARHVLPLAGPGDGGLLEVLETSARWLGGTHVRMDEGVATAWQTRLSMEPRVGWRLKSLGAAGIAITDARTTPRRAADAVNELLTAVAHRAIEDDRGGSDPRVVGTARRREVANALAAIIRTHVPCPTLDQLRAAYRRA